MLKSGARGEFGWQLTFDGLGWDLQGKGWRLKMVPMTETQNIPTCHSYNMGKRKEQKGDREAVVKDTNEGHRSLQGSNKV
jgi:hypothetical protein